jgi:hypothetical protein
VNNPDVHKHRGKNPPPAWSAPQAYNCAVVGEKGLTWRAIIAKNTAQFTPTNKYVAGDEAHVGRLRLGGCCGVAA